MSAQRTIKVTRVVAEEHIAMSAIVCQATVGRPSSLSGQQDNSAGMDKGKQVAHVLMRPSTELASH